MLFIVLCWCFTMSHPTQGVNSATGKFLNGKYDKPNTPPSKLIEPVIIFVFPIVTSAKLTPGESPVTLYKLPLIKFCNIAEFNHL